MMCLFDIPSDQRFNQRHGGALAVLDVLMTDEASTYQRGTHAAHLLSDGHKDIKKRHFFIAGKKVLDVYLYICIFPTC
jgi:hypothetical protein